MKKLKYALIKWLMIATGLIFHINHVSAQTPVQRNGQLRVIGLKLCNQFGNPIQLRGMSTHGIQWYGWGSCLTEASLDALAYDWGSDILRISLYVQEGGYETDPAGYTAQVSRLIDEATERGMYALVDWHQLTPGDPNANLSNARTFFTNIANAHKNKVNIIYDICNEPNGVTWARIKTYADQIIPVIRAIDTDAPIFIGTHAWASMGISDGRSAQDIVSNPVNFTNIMYTFHFYAKDHQDEYLNELSWAADRLPVFVTEWGTQEASGDGPNDFTMSQRYVDLMRQKKIGWTSWNYSDDLRSGAAWIAGTCSAGPWTANRLKPAGAWIRDRILSPADDFPGGTPTCQPVTASADDGNVASNVLDGNLTTRWSANGDGQWIQFCLDDTVSVSGVRIAFYNGNTRISTFDVLTGNDGINWSTAITNRSSSGTSTNLETFTFIARDAKYVRIVGHGNNVNLWNSYTEVEIITTTNAAPTVSITSPVTGTSFTAPATITINATAADSDGSVTKVEFFNGATKLGEDLTSPYSFTWSNVVAGSYTLTAKATDNGTAVTTSSPVTITVQPQPSCPAAIASADDGNVPGNVLDNNLTTRWSANGDGQWIQFCLSDISSITGVQIAFYNGNTRSSTFDILVGNDGSNWTTAATNRMSSGTSLNLETFSFAAVPGKYVRIVGHGNSVNLWNSYTEVKITTGTTGGQTYTLIPQHDAYVRNGTNAGVTHGTTDPNILITKLNSNPSAGNDRHTYLRFDISGVSGTVSSAVLRLYGHLADNRNNNIPVGAYAVSNTAWTESAITWNNKPATGASLQTATVTDSVARYYTWDITSYIQSEKAAGRNIISLALLNGTATDPITSWNSKETGNNPPQLVVTTSSSLRTMITQQAIEESNVLDKTTLTSYPNPFRDNSIINFSLTDAGPTQLSVYDIAGKEMIILVNGHLPAGSHRARLYADQLAAGVYILKLTHNRSVVTQKLLKQ